MADPNNQAPDTLAFLQSPVFKWIVVSMITQIMALLGHTKIAPDVVDFDATAVCQIIALAAAGYAAYKRWTSTVQPLTVKDQNK